MVYGDVSLAVFFFPLAVLTGFGAVVVDNFKLGKSTLISLAVGAFPLSSTTCFAVLPIGVTQIVTRLEKPVH